MKSNGDDYNPLAMLGGQLRKDGDDDPRSVLTFLIFWYTLTGGDRESAVLRTFLNCLTQALIGKISNLNFLND